MMFKKKICTKYQRVLNILLNASFHFSKLTMNSWCVDIKMVDDNHTEFRQTNWNDSESETVVHKRIRAKHEDLDVFNEERDTSFGSSTIVTFLIPLTSSTERF